MTGAGSGAGFEVGAGFGTGVGAGGGGGGGAGVGCGVVFATGRADDATGAACVAGLDTSGAADVGGAATGARGATLLRGAGAVTRGLGGVDGPAVDEVMTAAAALLDRVDVVERVVPGAVGCVAAATEAVDDVAVEDISPEAAATPDPAAGDRPATVTATVPVAQVPTDPSGCAVSPGR